MDEVRKAQSSILYDEFYSMDINCIVEIQKFNC